MHTSSVAGPPKLEALCDIQMLSYFMAFELLQAFTCVALRYYSSMVQA
jgi:hypothetical protein